MKIKKSVLALKALLKFILGFLVTGVLIFLPVGSFNFVNGWILMGILFIPMFFAGIIMLIKAPELLSKRINAKEKEKSQKMVIAVSAVMFIAGFVISGIGKRLDYYRLPMGISIAAAAVFFVAYIFYFEILRENAFLSRTVEIQKNQTVVDTGLYSRVRHPMYTVTIVMFLAVPLILGSAAAFLIFLLYPLIIVKRINSEEKLLTDNLEGYKEYKEKVKYRLVPFIW